MWICRDVRDDACVVDRNPLQRRAHLSMECGHWSVDSLANSMHPINVIDIVLRSSAFICHGFYVTGAGKKARLLILAVARVVHFATQASGDEQMNLVISQNQPTDRPNRETKKVF
jgi:hypothetical protein